MSPRRQRLILPVAPYAAGAAGIVTAAIMLLVPTDLLESAVVDSGVAAVLSAAEPPLGLTARMVLSLACGGGVALIAWFALFLVFGSRSMVLQRGAEADDAPVLRRADAHPDAPARAPLLANRDLGTPFLEVRATPKHVSAEIVVPPAPPIEQPLPVDLDQPLAAFDPAALPAEALDWFPPPASLPATRRQTFAPGERMETFALSPAPVSEAPDVPVAEQPTRAERPDPSETIHALLDRLERSVSRRAPEPAETLKDTLSALRKLATP